MKIALLILLQALQFPCFLNAQKIDVFWSNPIEGENYVSTNIAGIAEDYTYVFYEQSKMHGFFIQKLDANMKEIFLKEVSFLDETDTKKFSFHSIALINETLNLFYAIYQGNKNEHSLYLTQFDLSGKPTVNKIRQSTYNDFKPTKWNGNFSVLYSPDTSLVLIYRDIIEGGKENDMIEARLFFRNMKDLIWERKVMLPFNSNSVRSKNILLDNLGNIYVNCVFLRPIQKDGSGESIYSVFKIENTKGIVSEMKLDLASKRFKNIFLDIDNENNLFLSGFYHKGNENITRGFQTTKFDAAGNVIAHKDTSLNSVYLEDITKLKSIDSYPFTVKKIFPIKGDVAYIVAEQHKIETITMEIGSSGYTPGLDNDTEFKFHHFCDVVIVKLDEKLNVQWSTVIPKKQYSITKEFGSIIPVMFNNKILIVYNDNIHNTDVYSKEKLLFTKVVKDGAAVLAMIEPNGKYKKYPLFDHEKYGVVLNTARYFIAPNGDLIFNAQRGNGTMTIANPGFKEGARQIYTVKQTRVGRIHVQ
jgi:hypothetical protein